MVTKQRMSVSVEEYLALPDVKPYLEYFAGEVVQKASPKRKHWRLASELAAILNGYSKSNGGDSGPEPRIEITSAGQTYYLLPDIAYWAPGKPLGDDETTLPPTLAVEIRSPGQTAASQREKCRFYPQNGTDACWLVDPETRIVEVFEGRVDGARVALGNVLRSPLLPGLEIDVQTLFAVLDR